METVDKIFAVFYHKSLGFPAFMLERALGRLKTTTQTVKEKTIGAQALFTVLAKGGLWPFSNFVLVVKCQLLLCDKFQIFYKRNSLISQTMCQALL